MFYKIKSVKPLEDLIIVVEFGNNIKKTYDIKPLIKKWPVFQNLYNESLFKQAKVDIGGHGISWNENIDLSCNEIWENGKIIENK